MTTKAVKYFHSAMTGAPSLSGTVGSLIAVLDACLINGFSSNTVDSVVVSGSVATVTRSAGHPFNEQDMVVQISGATGSFTGLNGTHEVTAYTTTTYQFACPGVSDGTATGTITHKVAPAGWTKQYSGTNLAAYKSSNVAATGCLLRVDDTGTTHSRVVGYETMSDVNTGTGPFPTAAQIGSGHYWPKSSTADAVGRSWMVIADDRFFYLYTGYSASGYTFTGCFGDIVSRKSPDPYACVLNGGTAAFGPTVVSTDFFHSQNAPTNATVMPRSYTGIGSAVTCVRSNDLRYGYASHSGIAGIDYPNGADNGLYVNPHYCIEDTGAQVLRGPFPGAYFCPMSGVFSGGIAHRDRITGITGLSGKALRAVVNGGINGVGFIDTSGPWR